MLEQEGMDNIEVFSRGTLDWGENPRDANMVRIARELGYDPVSYTHLTLPTKA